MESLKLFAKYAPNITFIAVLLGAFSGLLYSALIPIVMVSLADDTTFPTASSITKVWGIEVANSNFASLFFGLCLVILIFRSTSEIMLRWLSLDIRHNLRTELYDRAQKAGIISLEYVGPSRLIQALANDVATVVIGAGIFPQILTSVVTTFGVLAVLAYLEFGIFVFVVKVIVFGIIVYQIPIMVATRYFAIAREHEDYLQEGFRGLISGAKELKLNEAKKSTYNDEVLQKEELTLKQLERKGSAINVWSGNFSGLLSFVAIGGVGFIFINYHDISTVEVFAAIMILLYLSGPVIMIMNFIPQLAITKISLRKIEQLYNELPNEGVSEEVRPVKPWQSMILKDVHFNYPQQKNHSKLFAIGPIDITINRGEITYITGGNGSGKSTLAKLITLHYQVSQGDVMFDDVKVDKSLLTDYRQQVACIYSDYYLFDRVLGTGDLSEDYKQRIDHYLKAFGIDNKVEFENGKFSTLKLSDGQRRRLALIVTIIEDKPLILFDEWAADQDPEFKDVFYREILPALKKQNKAIVVISHDDRYFDLADKMIVMESGKVVDPSQRNIPQYNNIEVI